MPVPSWLHAISSLATNHPEHILSQTPRETLSKVIYLLGALVSLAYEVLYYVSSDHFQRNSNNTL